MTTVDGGQNDSRSPLSPRYMLHGGIPLGMHNTFFSMERRRIQRQVSGRQVKHGIASAAAETATFLGFSLYGLASVRQKLLGPVAPNLSYLAFPVVLTVAIVVISIQQSCTVRENLSLLWAKVWGWLLIVWALWLYDPGRVGCHDDHGNSIDPVLFGSTQGEHVVFGVFLSLEAATLFLWFVFTKMFPLIVQRLRSKCALRYFWRVRKSQNRPGYSYKPNGWFCSPRRSHFQYEGNTLPCGLPQGKGVWRNDHYHGEILDGVWEGGCPLAPFVSRVFGNNAISIALKIAYGTCRAEALDELRWRPSKSIGGGMRFGVLGVECSASGGFLAHLPQVVENQHRTFDDVGALVADMHGSAAAAPALLASFSAAPETPLRSSAQSLPDDAAGIDRNSFRHRMISPFQAAQLGPFETTALVLVHGYNCPINWACMRLGQLCVLGKFGADILPIVFSWSCGKLFSYFDVVPQLPEMAADFGRFIELLRRAGVTKFHVLAHSMGCELVNAALPSLEALVCDADTRTLQFPIATITLLNSTSPVSVFLSELPRLGCVCSRLTLYCDRNDFALRAAEFLGGRGESIGRWVRSLAQGTELGNRVDIVDCTSMDANMGDIRHSYFDLNTQVVGDLHELVCFQLRASQRTRLVRKDSDTSSNAFAFLAPPVFVCW